MIQVKQYRTCNSCKALNEFNKCELGYKITGYKEFDGITVS